MHLVSCGYIDYIGIRRMNGNRSNAAAKRVILTQELPCEALVGGFVHEACFRSAIENGMVRTGHIKGIYIGLPGAGGGRGG